MTQTFITEFIANQPKMSKYFCFCISLYIILCPCCLYLAESFCLKVTLRCWWMFCIINYNICKETHGASPYNCCRQIKIINHATSLPIWLIQLWRIDKNMKLIWLKDVKEPTGECHKQWMVTAWRKINGRGWSPSRVLLGSVAVILEKSCLLACLIKRRTW